MRERRKEDSTGDLKHPVINRKPKSEPETISLIINTTHHPDISVNLEQSAIEHIRSINHQALAYIVKGLKDDGYPKGKKIT
jgi:hypothetical protein